MSLDYVALIIMVLVAIILFYGIIAIHDIPYEIAKKRNHPHQDAIHYAGWLSLFTLHVLWPFLWIWATLWREERGWGMQPASDESQLLQQQISLAWRQIANMEQEIAQLKNIQAERQVDIQEGK